MTRLATLGSILVAAMVGGVQAADLMANITAITGRDGISVLECWQLANPFVESDVVGRIGTSRLDLGDIDGAHWDIIPAEYDGGLHNAPGKQFVYWLSGMVHFTLPNGTDEAWITGGKYGLIFGDDTEDISEWGHGTAYPAKEETISLTMPMKDGVVPEHTVLHDGGCTWDEMVAL